MDKYQGMPAFEADASVTMTSHDTPAGPTSKRVIRYARPNRFRVVSSLATLTMTSVCNGEKLVEYSNQPGVTAVSYPAPSSLVDATSPQMSDPVFCGSLLYQFFGGSGNYAALVDSTKASVTYGEEESGDGELARVVRFYATQKYGHAEVLIGEETGRVYRIACDLEPMLKIIQAAHDSSRAEEAREIAGLKPGPELERLKKHIASEAPPPAPKELRLTESYSHIKTDSTPGAVAFDVAAPKGMDVVDTPGDPTGTPPVPIGSPAPDIQVQGLDGRNVKLSALRGHVVYLDFWATWCPPCRKGLPETAHVAKLGSSCGLEVLAISGEKPGPVTAYLQKQPFRLPAFLDDQGAAAKAYNADAIPTTAVVDAKGNLSAYFVGLQEDKTVEAALRKAGAQLGS